MILSPDQQTAYDLVGEWLAQCRAERLTGRLSRPAFVLHGGAGTGKTTLARELSAMQDGLTMFMAYTGKAASVLTDKGMAATTVHRAIYLPKDEVQSEIADLEDELKADPAPNEKRMKRIWNRLTELRAPKFALRDRTPLRSASLVVLDECSLMNQQNSLDLLSFNVPVLVLGDPFQLPPIEGKPYFNDPDFTLTEIHRQAKGNPIIQLAYMAKNGERLKHGAHDWPKESGVLQLPSHVIRKKEVTKEIVFAVEQVIVGGNKSRIELNNEVRAIRGFDRSVLPLRGERLICLRNNEKEGFANGETFETETDAEVDAVDDRFFTIRLKGILSPVKIHVESFTKPDKLKASAYSWRARANEFTFAYAVTGHKFQGSQAKSCLVYADMFQWDRVLYNKWLYTCLTRAEEFVIAAL